MQPLVDPFERRIRYLRVSVTPYCNFRCSYCQPEGPVLDEHHREELSPLELEKILSLFARLGVEKVRLTGGEPTLRKDLEEMVRRITSIPGIREVTLSTHGLYLDERSASLAEAGLSRINVSLDTLRPERFARISGRDELPRVLRGITAAQKAGLTPIKLNVVPLRGFNEDELGDFLEYSARENLHLRFIALMQLGVAKELYRKSHLSLEELQERLSSFGDWEEQRRGESDGPARLLRRRSDGLRVGLIDPLSKNFCQDCNRLRLTHRGEVRNCLFGEGNVALRPLLQRPDWESALEELLRKTLLQKPEKHRLEHCDDGGLYSLAKVGG